MVEEDTRSISRWYDSIFFLVVFPVLAFLLWMLMRSYRLIKVAGREGVEEAIKDSGGRAIYTIWHQRLILPIRLFARRGICVMVSQSRDGEYASRFLNLLGIETVRGSSTRGGYEALRILRRKIKAGTDAGLVVDGPVGPAREAKIGAPILSRIARIPMVPMSWGTDRCWIFNSWDRFMVPKPFARIIYRYGEPIWVPQDASGEELERFRQVLDERLNQGTRWCDEQMGEERPWRKVAGERRPERGPLQPGPT